MALRRRQAEREEEPSDPSDTTSGTQSWVRFPRPKVLLVDLPTPEVEHLRNGGYNVQAGTFGEPHSVGKADRFQPVGITTARLPNYTEQEVVVVDLALPELVDDPPIDAPPPGVKDVWASCKSGVIDPRPRAMRMVRRDFDRIYKHGGIFIFILDVRTPGDYVSAEGRERQGLYVHETLDWDNYGCLTRLAEFQVRTDFGTELAPC